MAATTFEEQLINAICLRRFLYDKKHPDHSRRKVVNKAWQEVANEVKRPENVCKKRWRSLRDRFYTLHRDNNQRGQGGENNFETIISWPYYTLLGFLENLNQPRNKTARNLRVEDISLNIPGTSESSLHTGIDSSNPSSEHNTGPNSPQLQRQVNNTSLPSPVMVLPDNPFQSPTLNLSAFRERQQVKRPRSVVLNKTIDKIANIISTQSQQDAAMCLQLLQNEYSSSNSCFAMFIRHELDAMCEEEQDDFKFGVMDLLQDIKTARRSRAE